MIAIFGGRLPELGCVQRAIDYRRVHHLGLEVGRGRRPGCGILDRLGHQHRADADLAFERQLIAILLGIPFGEQFQARFDAQLAMLDHVRSLDLSRAVAFFRNYLANLRVVSDL